FDFASGDPRLQVVEALGGLRKEVLAGGEALLGGTLLRDKAVEWGDLGVVIDGEEQRKGEAFFLDRPHPVRGGNELAVRPNLHHVADVDYERPRDRRRVDPSAGAVEHLESWRGGIKQREAFVVGVRSDAHGFTGARVERIMDESELAGRLPEKTIEEVGSFPERKRKAAHEHTADPEHGVVIALHRLAKVGHIRPLIGTE